MAGENCLPCCQCCWPRSTAAAEVRARHCLGRRCRVPAGALWWQLRLCTGRASALAVEQQRLLPALVTAFQGSASEAGGPSSAAGGGDASGAAAGPRVRVEVPVEVPLGADGQPQVAVQVPAATGSGQAPVSVTVDVSGLVDAVQAGVQQAAANSSAAQGSSGSSSSSSSSGAGRPKREVVKALPRVSCACSG